jgi:hypothetical protein
MRILNFCFIVLVISFTTTCRKDPTTLPPGTVEVRVFVHHHGVPIASAKVYRKDSTIIFPGRDINLYGTHYQADEQGLFSIPGIGNGQRDFVLYAEGIDPNWDSTLTTPVWGYQFLSVYTRPGKDTIIQISLPVSE